MEAAPDGSVVANLESKKKLSGDALLYAVGRQGNVDELNLAAPESRPIRAGGFRWMRISHQGSRISMPSAT